MSLPAGARIGQYEVGAQLGAGGMGEVYKARDTRLQRQVAIKILPAAFAADPDRLARFEREAQVLASLNHPNIAQIYGVEEKAGVTALVMELVDGNCDPAGCRFCARQYAGSGGRRQRHARLRPGDSARPRERRACSNGRVFAVPVGEIRTSCIGSRRL